ncbi:hypothetical protein BH11PSE11_BH11PSE11_23430 [soil metagenome]
MNCVIKLRIQNNHRLGARESDCDEVQPGVDEAPVCQSGKAATAGFAAWGDKR